MRILIKGAIGLALFIIGIGFLVAWFTFRIEVAPGYCAVLTRQTGRPLPEGQIVASEPGQQGIQVGVLGPGRHWRNPYTWKWEIVPMTRVDAGDPKTWQWIHSIEDPSGQNMREGSIQFNGKFPEIGLVTRKIGKNAPTGMIVVDRKSEFKGVLREVLTPGSYKLNPYVFEVEPHPAAVIPSGFVGVVTNKISNPSGTGVATSADDNVSTKTDSVPDVTASEHEGTYAMRANLDVRPLAKPGQKGILRDVLQPGVYFINPKLKRVTLVEIGFNEFSQLKLNEAQNYRIEFPSDTGYRIRVGVTVIWGIHPRHAAQIINEYGNIDSVLDKVIGPQLRSICRNIGSTYAARDFIQGKKRELFQRDLTDELKRVCAEKHVEVLLALVREIEVHAPTAGRGEVTEDLKRTIQESYIAIENQITKAKQREAEEAKAQLEEELKKIDIAREEIAAETLKIVAGIRARAEKEAASISAQGRLEVATIEESVAKLAAKKVEILGRAEADVEKLKKAAEAEGYRMLVDAFGSPQAFNLFTFADNFQPQEIKLFFAGDGTFWTDLSRFEEVGAARIMQSSDRDLPAASARR